ncbi:phage tail protein [Vibrio fluvialis]
MSIPESALSYGSILTLLGENAEINGKLNNKSIEFTHIAIGDANDEYVQPSRTQTTLVNEITRIPVTGMEKIEPSEEGGIPQLKVWAKIPDEIVDVAVREFAAIAVYDGNSYLHAVGNSVRIPILSAANNGGEVNDIYIEMTFAVTSLDPIIMIDPSIVTATRKYVDDQDAKHVAEENPHPQYPLAVNTVIGENSTRTTRIDEAAAKGSLPSGFWTVYTNKNLGYFPVSKLTYPIHLIKAAYYVPGNKGGIELAAGDSTTSALFFRVSTGVGAGALQQLYSDINPPHVSKVTGVQYAPYDSSRIYKCGEICTTEVDGQVLFWEWYSNVEALAGKDPSLIENRQDGWEDDTKPYYWMPHKKARAGTPLFPWFSETIPEGTLNVVGNSVPVAVFWRLAAAFPEFVNADTQMIDFPETRSEFFRVLDQGRGVDTDRVLGSAQEQSIEHHGIQLMGKGSADAVTIGNVVHLGRRGTGVDPVGILGYAGLAPMPNQYYDNYAGTPYGNYSDGADETRPSNLAFPVLVEV